MSTLPSATTFRFGEFFGGPGGLALAATRMLTGNTTMAHSWSVDFDPNACATYRTNICPDAPDSVIQADIRKLNMRALPAVDALLFGFPCNDFSAIGERKGFDGEYGPLYRYPLGFLETRQPKFFFAENVTGLVSANEGRALKQIVAEMADAGYRVTVHLYRFEKYGVPQARHRIGFVGIREDLGLTFRVPAPSGRLITVDEALRDIPADAANHEFSKLSALVAERLAYIPPGGNIWDVNETLPPHLRYHMTGGARLSTIYKRLHGDRPAYTVTGSGGGGTAIYHHKECRALTNRERARLQSFPDSYVFSGGRGAVRKQIGMAVPPVGAAKVLQAVMDTFSGTQYPTVEPSIGVFSSTRPTMRQAA